MSRLIRTDSKTLCMILESLYVNDVLYRAYAPERMGLQRPPRDED